MTLLHGIPSQRVSFQAVSNDDSILNACDVMQSPICSLHSHVECHLSVSSFQEFLIIFNCRWRWQTVDKVVQLASENVTRDKCNLFLMREALRNVVAPTITNFPSADCFNFYNRIPSHTTSLGRPHIYANTAKSRTIFVFVLSPEWLMTFKSSNISLSSLKFYFNTFFWSKNN